MANPPDGKYHKPYDGQTVKTADGVVIAEGLRVFTNELSTGVITLDGARFEWHSVENRYVLWFHVRVDTNYRGEPVEKVLLQSDDRVATRFEGKSA